MKKYCGLLGALVDFNGQTALHFCSSKNNLSVARTLVGQGASARIKDKRGQLALHRAAAIGSVPILQLLLKNKSPVNATDGSRQTALHHAISEGHGDAAMLLIKEGAETNKKDADDHLAIELAPDKKVFTLVGTTSQESAKLKVDQVFDFIKASADREGFNLEFDAK
ncbi:MAG: hypothetical protein M1814_003640 [Vezdaea aestivalis]|nr:MAG: hypothetical protein M1814_003640 [Vezdaea aestivalis]